MAVTVTYTGSGASGVYVIPFPYIDKSHVICTVNSVPTTALTWISATQVQVTPTPGSTQTVRFTRDTPNAPLVEFADDARFDKANLDLAILQAIYLAEEAEAEEGPGGVGSYLTGGQLLNRALILSSSASDPVQVDLTPLIRGYYSTRSALVSVHTVLAENTVMSAAGLVYVKDNGSGIPDMPGWSPMGGVYPDHFAQNTSPGTTNMTTAIQTAIGYREARGGGQITFRAVLYGVSDTIQKTTNTTLRGEGSPKFLNDYVDNGLLLEGPWLHLLPGSNCDVVKVTYTGAPIPSGNYPRAHAGIYDLGIHGNRSGLVTQSAVDRNWVGNGLVLDGVSYVDIHNVIILRAAESNLLAGTAGDQASGYRTTNNLSIDNVVCLQARFDGARLFGGDSKISGLVCGANGRDGLNGSMGPVTNSKFWNNGRYGVGCQSYGFVLTGCDIYDNGQTGIAVLSGTGYVLDACRIFDNGRNGTLSGNDRAGVFIAELAGTVVVSNCVFSVQNGTRRIAFIGPITGGSGYTNGVYENVALNGGTGTGARARITIAGGSVTEVLFDTNKPADRGTGYTNGDILTISAASVGGTGSGFSVTVTTISYNFAPIYGVTGNQLFGISATSGTPRATIVGCTYEGVTPYNITDASLCTFDVFRYGTRAQAVAAVPGLPPGAIFEVRDISWVKDGISTVISDMPGVAPLGQEGHINHWRAINTSIASSTSAAIAAIEWMNAGTGRRIVFPGGAMNINAALPAITATDFEVNLNNTQLIMHSTAGANGSFFTFGSSVTQANRGRLHGGTIQCNNTPDENHYALDFVRATDVDVYVKAISVAGVWRMGSTFGAAVRCDVHVEGTYGKGLNANANFLIQSAANCTFTGATSATGGPANVNATGAILRIAPLSGSVVDTMRFQGFTTACISATGATDGKPYGIDIDHRLGDVTNLYFSPETTFDHTSVAAVRIYDTVGSVGILRGTYFMGCRFATAAGRGLLIDKASAANEGLIAGLRFIGNTFTWQDAVPCIDISGAGINQLVFQGNTIGAISVTSKPSAIRVNADNLTVIGNSIGPNQNFASNIQIGIDVVLTGATSLVIQDNHIHPDIPTQIRTPVWTQSIAPRRQIARPGQVPHFPAVIPDTGSFFPLGIGFGSNAPTQGVGSGANLLQIAPFVCQRSFVADGFAMQVTAALAGSESRVVIYSADERGRPANLLLESAAIPMTSTGVALVATTLRAGGNIRFCFEQGETYWIGCINSVAGFSFCAWANNFHAFIANTTTNLQSSQARHVRRTVTYTGAMPNPWVWGGSAETNVGAPPAIWARVAA